MRHGRRAGHTVSLAACAVVLVGLAGPAKAAASVSFQRTDVAMPAQPDSVAIGDLDGVHGKDIAVGLWFPGSIGVMLNRGDGTFAPLQTYTGGEECAEKAEDVTLGDVTRPVGDRMQPDGRLDAYVACTPYVVRLTGDGAGALGNPEPFQLFLPPYLGADTIDFLTLMRRPDGNPAPLLVLQHSVGSFGRELCISSELDSEQLACNDASVQGPMTAGDLNGSVAGVPPDEVLTGEAGEKLGIFGFAPTFPLDWSDTSRPAPGGVESLALGDVDSDHDLDVVAGQTVNSTAARADSIHYYKLNPAEGGGLEHVPTALPSTPGVDAVAVADVDGDTCNDIVAAGVYGMGMVHLGDGHGVFDGGQDLPQLASGTRVSMAVDDLTGDGLPEVVISDKVNAAVSVYRNTSSSAGGPCSLAPPPPVGDDDDAAPVVNGPSLPPPPPPPPPAPVRTCTDPGVTRFTVGTPGDDVLVGSNDRDVLSGRGGDDCLFGRANDDRLTGGTGADLLDGGSGGDRINGDAGEDKIRAGRGNDTITPGAGKDAVAAQGGDDEIFARDTTRDTIDCGAGVDKVKADRTDTVKSCEYVKRAARRAR